MKKCSPAKAPKAKTPPAKRLAEGGYLGSKTLGEAASKTDRYRSGGTSGAGELNRRASGYPQQGRRMDDSPEKMAANRRAARKR